MELRGQTNGLKKLLNIEPKRSEETGLIEYHFDDRGKDIVFRFDEIFHIPGMGFDGIVGYSPSQWPATSFGMAAEEFASRFYGNGANVGAVVTIPNAVRQQALKTETIKICRAWKVAQGYVPEKAPNTTVDMPLADAEFIATREFRIDKSP